MEGIGTISDQVTGGGSRWFLSYSALDCAWKAVELGADREGNGESAIAAFASALKVPAEQIPRWAHELADTLEDELQKAERYPCPCCGFLTLFGRGQWGACPVCRWEDEPHLGDDPNRHSALNGLTLGEARANYAAFGAATEEKRQRVRPPLPDEIPR